MGAVSDESAKLLGESGAAESAAAPNAASVTADYNASRAELAASPARRAALRGARAGVYAYQFCASAGWGVYNTTYTYYLMEVGGYSSSAAANYATGEWIAYALAQFLTTPVWGAVSDRVGRRPLLLGGAGVGSLCMVTYAWPYGPWWIAVGAIQGSTDCTWALCNAIVVDCVTYGAPPGAPDDWVVARVFRRLAMPASSATALDGDVRQELAAAMTWLWCVGGAGSLTGFGLGYALWTYLPHGLAIASCGLCVWPALLYCALFLAETAPDAPTGGAGPTSDPTSLRGALEVCGDGVRAQARAVPMLFRDRRSSLLTASYFALYVVLTGVFDLVLFWGEVKFDWSVGDTSSYLAIAMGSPAIGALLAARVLFPSSLGYASSIALLLALTAAGAVAEGLVRSSAAAFAVAPLAVFGWGVYPCITALLTPDEAHANQGHLQGALYAITTLGSVLALGVYLAVYDLTVPDAADGSRAARTSLAFSSIWLLSAGLLLLAAAAAYAAGDAPAAGAKDARVAEVRARLAKDRATAAPVAE